MKNSYRVIGVMSGTSLDGVDLAAIDFNWDEGRWNFQIIHAETVSYSINWKNRLKHAIDLPQESLHLLNVEYTGKLGEIIREFISKNDIHDLDAVCSHGHTILHRPDLGYTLQIGNLPEIVKIIGHTVVCDFRTADVVLGGQGAPLVPIGDALLFSEYEFCLNLGGFANISFEKNEKRIAFDICPVNIVLNSLANKIGLEYDAEGKQASIGKVNSSLLKSLNELPFYRKLPPKSLGLEWVRAAVFPLIESHQVSTEDALRTFVEHIAVQICKHLNLPGKVLVTGGGAWNDFLMERIRSFSKAEIVIPESEIIDFKEALIFGFLGVLKLRGEVNCLAEVTGAEKDHSSGVIFTD